MLPTSVRHRQQTTLGQRDVFITTPDILSIPPFSPRFRSRLSDVGFVLAFPFFFEASAGIMLNVIALLTVFMSTMY
jgi:hypothetical protein